MRKLEKVSQNFFMNEKIVGLDRQGKIDTSFSG